MRPFLIRWGRRLAVVASCLMLFAGVNWWFGPIRPLVLSASDIHDYEDDSWNFTGDFVRLIRARCPEDTFRRYAAQQGFVRQLTGNEPSSDIIMSWNSCPEPWWTPPENKRGTFYSYKEGGECRRLAYADGYLYYEICVW